ncbi:hypothetical protein L3i20_v239740 [Paenibacillus sp. L3-i20]|nr:hypothetical protein L3i20_v239740 [Paenibacillus sp. L3-i20]
MWNMPPRIGDAMIASQEYEKKNSKPASLCSARVKSSVYERVGLYYFIALQHYNAMLKLDHL